MRRRLRNMPTVGTVAGVKVMIFYADHAPPHVHLEKGEAQVVASILDPFVPPRMFTAAERRAVLRWLREYRVELLANWALAQAGQPLFRITP